MYASVLLRLLTASPSIVIDLATLTGACVVALGEHAAGLFGNNKALIQSVQQAGLDVNERAWPVCL
jgi:leucyl aminopeptidase